MERRKAFIRMGNGCQTCLHRPKSNTGKLGRAAVMLLIHNSSEQPYASANFDNFQAGRQLLKPPLSFSALRILRFCEAFRLEPGLPLFFGVGREKKRVSGNPYYVWSRRSRGHLGRKPLFCNRKLDPAQCPQSLELCLVSSARTTQTSCRSSLAQET